MLCWTTTPQVNVSWIQTAQCLALLGLADPLEACPLSWNLTLLLGCTFTVLVHTREAATRNMEKIQVIKVSDAYPWAPEIVCEKLQSKDWAVQSFGTSKVKAERYSEHVDWCHMRHIITVVKWFMLVS